MSKQVPDIGDIVHVVLSDTVHLPAIVCYLDITKIPAEAHVTIFGPKGTGYTKVTQDEVTRKKNTWHWPEKEPASNNNK